MTKLDRENQHKACKQEQPHYIGHRKRLKSKFLKSNPSDFNDYELLELLLFQATPRKDVKPLAKEMLKIFGSFNNLINADEDKVLALNNASESSFLQLKILRELLNRIFYHKIQNKNIIGSWTDLIDYLSFNMGCLKIEQFRILFLDKKNMLITDEVISTGTIDQTPVYPREIVKKTLFHEASSIILVHNHPSANTKPSSSDIDLTTQIVNACNTINVKVHDHVIISTKDYYSFKSNMLL